MLYKILSDMPVEAAKDGSQPLDQVIPLRPFDVRTGFIHLCTKNQLALILNEFFKTSTKLVILNLDISDNKDTVIAEGKTGNKYRSTLKWEFSKEYNQDFPHLYGDLVNEDIESIQYISRPSLDEKWHI